MDQGGHASLVWLWRTTLYTSLYLKYYGPFLDKFLLFPVFRDNLFAEDSLKNVLGA